MTSPANALCFGEGLPASGAPCHVAVSAEGLRLTGTGSHDLPGEVIQFSGLSVAAGGLDHDHLVVSWSQGARARTLYVKDPAVIVTFRRTAPAELTAHLDRTAEEVRRARHRHRTVWAAAGAVVIALGLFLWFGSDLLVEWAVARIPIEWEQKLGESAYHDFLSGQTVLKEGPGVAATWWCSPA